MRTPILAILGMSALLSPFAFAQSECFTNSESACSESTISRLPVSLQDPFQIARLTAAKRKAPAAQPRFGGSDIGWMVKDLKLSKDTAVSANRLKIPGKAQSELEKALKDAGKREFDKARKHLYAALAVYPRFSDAVHNLGVIALLEGREMEAATLFQQALEYDPRNAYPLFALAQIHLNHEQPDEAQRYVERFLTLSPTNPYGLSLLANVEMAQGRYDAALRTFARLNAMDHKELAAFHLLAGSLYELRHAEQRAIEEYRLYLKEAPRAADAAEVASAIGELQTYLARK